MDHTKDNLGCPESYFDIYMMAVPTTMTQSHSFSSAHKSRTVHQGKTTPVKTDKPSPGTSLKVTRGQTTLSEYVCENGWNISDPRDSTTIHTMSGTNNLGIRYSWDRQQMVH